MTMILVVVMLIIGFWFKAELCAKKKKHKHACQNTIKDANIE